MGNVVIVKADLFETCGLDAIGHGVNCMGVMGSGIAVAFKNKWPEMYEEYVDLCNGGFLRPGGTFSWVDDAGLYIWNLATQMGFSRSGTADAKVEWISQAVNEMLELLENDGMSDAVIGLPWIGCGLGGLKRNDVWEVLDRNVTGRNATIIIHEVG